MGITLLLYCQPLYSADNTEIFTSIFTGGVNVSVSCPGEAGKTINEKMLDGGCIQRFRVSFVKFFLSILYAVEL